MDTLKWTREPKSYAIKEKYFSFIVKTEFENVFCKK
jgi:hypothetical protein